MSADLSELLDTAQTAPDAGQFPLTCTWCHRQPATHLSIADWLFKGQTASVRQQNMLCTPCASSASVLPGECLSWWLFDLTLHDYEKEWPS